MHCVYKSEHGELNWFKPVYYGQPANITPDTKIINDYDRHVY